MSYETEQRLKGYLDTNQLHREQMCRAILSVDKRFSDVRPRHPRGGPDGGRDIQALYRDSQLAFGAVGFVNQANDSDEQKRTIRRKFEDDLNSATSGEDRPEVFIFFTNLNLTIGEKESLIEKAKQIGMSFCDILDRERLRIALDSPDGFAIRYQYLNISLSEAEQASFFARWGDDIQALVSTGFQRIENTLHRILFLQEASDSIEHLTLSFQLNENYSAEEIGHFRLFCSIHLKEPKLNVWAILFGSSDKPNRMRRGTGSEQQLQKPGIKHGIGSGQWEQLLDHPDNENNDNHDQEDFDERYQQVGASSRIGMDEIEIIPISYSKYSFIRFSPCLTLRDFDDSMFLPFMNKSLAEKIKAIHVFANGYKLQEIDKEGLRIDYTQVTPQFPVSFTAEELADPWVRIRPNDGSSLFHLRFFDETPKRLFAPTQTKNSLESRGK